MDYAKAIEILNKFEYSSDGFPKRYPDDTEFEEARSFLRSFVPGEKTAATAPVPNLMAATFGPLFEDGNLVQVHMELHPVNGWILKVGGFYKHGNVTIHYLNPRSLALPDNVLGFRVVGRYGVLDDIHTFEDLVYLNFREWQNYEAKGFNIDQAWLPYLISHGLVEKVETITYKAKD